MAMEGFAERRVTDHGSLTAERARPARAVAVPESGPPSHWQIPTLVDVRNRAESDHAVLLSTVQSPDELISAALMWSGERIDEALRRLPQLVADRLRELETANC
jgi:hypothetical protein